MYELADAKGTTVAELIGTRRKHSKIRVPDKLRDFVGEDYIFIEHHDEGLSGTELAMWGAFYELKKKESESGR